MSFLSVLTIIFIVLKLVGIIDWSWWFVVMPTILQAIIFVVIILLTVYVNKQNTK